MSQARSSVAGPFDALNPAQRAAVEHGAEALRAGGRPGPLLVIAGAGSGKTRTLTARVAGLILHGADPRRVLLLTFTRRAAREMTRRARGLVAEALGDQGGAAELPWSGTFHSVGQRLLRLHAGQLGLSSDFTVLDRADAEDLLDIVRDEGGFAARTERRFPRKGPCLAIYSLAVNARRSLDDVLQARFPQYETFAEDLRELFAAYVDAKQARDLLDYDDLLLYWARALQEPSVAAGMAARFDHVLVDEYQDTNAVQEEILLGLCPDGAGLTAVGDDAQSIYGFRAATVDNILRFPQRFEPAARVVTLEQSYRARQPLLAAANAVIAQAARRYTKELYSRRGGSERPSLGTLADESAQVDHVAGAVLARREEGVELHRQAVLMRAGWHSGALEVELGRRGIPFVKYGGLKFLEASHVKDALAVLRWAENPRDRVAAFRALQILPGIGPGYARRALAAVDRAGTIGAGLQAFAAPPAARDEVAVLAELMARLTAPGSPWPAQPGLARQWYTRHIERLHDNPQVRARDLEQLEQIARGYPDRGRFLAEVALEPPETAGDEAGAPLIDDDYLVLSTIHSAKGQEYDTVYVLNVVDGCIPSDMATGDDAEIEEERRLLYVAMTRARERLQLLVPRRFYRTNQRRHGDGHVSAAQSRFLPDAILDRFERRAPGVGADAGMTADDSGTRVDLKRAMRDMWRH
ncbi:MAG: ATP-dependent helicase [Halofilum sp. (in: g-proteobacteria)]|nr:ATP-dependent helicase [Halofilum sp. (in: g-proteobacteria)]